MLDQHADDFFTPEWPEPQARREAEIENRPSRVSPTSIETGPRPQAPNPTNPQSEPPQPQRTQPPAEPSPDPGRPPDSCLVPPDSSASGARRASSRENGRKSHGPKTAEGKARSSMNALKHGLTARQVCVGLEDEDEWNEFREEARRLLEPVGVIELEYADEWAASRWRLRRAYGIETLLFDTELARQESESSEYKDMDAVARIGLAFKAAKEDINALGRYASRIHRAGENAHKMLLQLQRARQSACQNEPEPKWREPSGRNITRSAGSHPAVPGSQPGPLQNDRQTQSAGLSGPNCQNESDAPIPAVPGEPAPEPAMPPQNSTEIDTLTASGLRSPNPDLPSSWVSS